MCQYHILNRNRFFIFEQAKRNFEGHSWNNFRASQFFWQLLSILHKKWKGWKLYRLPWLNSCCHELMLTEKLYVTLVTYNSQIKWVSVYRHGMLVMFNITSLPFHLLIQYALPHPVKYNFSYLITLFAVNQLSKSQTCLKNVKNSVAVQTLKEIFSITYSIVIQCSNIQDWIIFKTFNKLNSIHTTYCYQLTTAAINWIRAVISKSLE